jgi:hypothetical protein
MNFAAADGETNGVPNGISGASARRKRRIFQQQIGKNDPGRARGDLLCNVPLQRVFEAGGGVQAMDQGIVKAMLAGFGFGLTILVGMEMPVTSAAFTSPSSD